MSLIKKLVEIQTSLNAPKNQRNNFGKYNYRSCEDILEAVKPHLKQQGLFLFINDEIELIGDRYYVKATATITDGENSHSATAHAREEQQKKGMDAAQLTGATSSYARKYALNGLFCIDDNKDADTNEQRQQVNNAPQQKPAQLKSQQPQFDGQDFLMRWTHIAQSCQALSALDQQKAKVLTPAWKQLNKQQQAAAKEVYDACKEDLETKGV